jgi:hypothetical protein
MPDMTSGSPQARECTNMINFIQATILAAKNRSRVARILREIDAPRNQAIKEARLCAQQYREQLTAEYAASPEGPWEGFDR